MAASGRACVCCGKALGAKYPNRLYCSQACSHKALRGRLLRVNPGHGIPRRSVGASAELVVAADLLNRGYQVFRSVSAHAECDLVILKDGRLLTVEVRTSQRKMSGEVSLSPLNVRMRADIGAIVVFMGRTEITYVPPLPCTNPAQKESPQAA